ncbi:tyrosine-type recombinase/integrase [Lactobacillus sp. YT155]|uniref:tyrosine-type recombinase/integrase n=1 Tax=Lactobacillus sp. YT155 TaxID=3060955 RepID=UPI00265F0B24|nr:tyrosine-type recombinase/integrase [Lactobacillus sp. YT155]MDO1604791.1 tyrosine-type recombinase/integrase [Lactobacillus sp. YT155]
MDNRIKKYIKKDGKPAYKFQVYLGIDKQTGKKLRTTRRGFRKLRDAELELKKIDYKVANKTLELVNTNKNITFQEVYEEWYQGYINTVRESTFNRTQGMFDNHILPAFGNLRIRTIKPVQCQKALNQWYNETTRNYKRWFNYVQAVFDYAVKQDYTVDNPARKINMPKKHEKIGPDIPNFWDKSQLQVFFSNISENQEPEKYCMFRLLAFGGLRRGECLALTWSDLDFKNNTLSINKTLTQGLKGKQIVQATKTRKSNRIISIDHSTMESLKKWRLLQKKIFLTHGFNTLEDNQLIFATRNNTHKSLNTPSKWLQKIIEQTELPKITVHGFRHSHASALFSAGATIKEVQDRLGHEDAQTTLNIYTHVTEKQDKEAVDKLVNYLNI